MITAHTPQYAAGDAILLQAKFPWLPEEVFFCASPTDPEAHGRELYARAIAGEFGPIAEYVAPPVVVIVPARVEMAQARLALLDAGHLATVETAMASMPKDAQIEWEFRTHVARHSPLVTAVAALLSLTEQQLDELFVLAASK